MYNWRFRLGGGIIRLVRACMEDKDLDLKCRRTWKKLFRRVGNNYFDSRIGGFAKLV